MHSEIETESQRIGNIKIPINKFYIHAVLKIRIGFVAVTQVKNVITGIKCFYPGIINLVVRFVVGLTTVLNAVNRKIVKRESHRGVGFERMGNGQIVMLNAANELLAVGELNLQSLRISQTGRIPIRSGSIVDHGHPGSGHPCQSTSGAQIHEFSGIFLKTTCKRRTGD